MGTVFVSKLQPLTQKKKSGHNWNELKQSFLCQSKKVAVNQPETYRPLTGNPGSGNSTLLHPQTHRWEQHCIVGQLAEFF